MKILTRLAALLVALLPLYPTYAVVPETGMWWSATEPGRAYFIDVQGDTVFLIAFAYEADGAPTFYAGSGTLRLGFGEVPGFDPVVSTEGYEPWHFVVVELFRFQGGACLTCNYRPATGERVGAAQMWFDHTSYVRAYISLDDGSFAWQTLLTRFNFAYTPFATTTPGVPPPVPDLRGDWVFVDTLDRSVPAWRFNFSRTEQSVPNIGRTTPPPWQVTFFDDGRNARFVCRQESPGLFPTARISGCQLFLDEQPVFWARQEDLGLDRVQAGYGRVPTTSERYRGTGIILGHRVE